MELPAKTSPGRRWCLSAAPSFPGMPRPGGVKGRVPLPLARRRNRGMDQGPVFRCALRPRSGPTPARGAAPPARPRPGPGPAPCCSAGRAAGGSGRHGPGRAPLPEGGWGLPPEPGSGAAAYRSGRTRSGLGTGPAGRVVAGCCRLGKGCRKTSNSPATTRGRGVHSDGAPRIPRPGAPGHAVRPRPQPRTGENMVPPPPLLLILGIETKSPFLRRASGLPPGHRVRAAAALVGCGGSPGAGDVPT